MGGAVEAPSKTRAPPPGRSWGWWQASTGLYLGAVAGGATQHVLNRNAAVDRSLLPPPARRVRSLSVRVHPQGLVVGGAL